VTIGVLALQGAFREHIRAFERLGVATCLVRLPEDLQGLDGLVIPGGEFFMGSEEKDALDTEKPPHRVKLTPYCIDELEVTVAQYKECSDRGGCRRVDDRATRRP